MKTGEDYSGLAIKLLIYIAGAATTLIGSWVSSKIRIYHDARNAHRDELKQKLLQPLRDTLQSWPTVPRYEIKWDLKKYDDDASAQETPVTMGSVVVFDDRGVVAQKGLDEVLFEDAQANHHRQLISKWEAFKNSWGMARGQLEEWFKVTSRDLLDSSLMPAHSGTFSQRYIMNLHLTGFVYQRLLLQGVTTLNIEQKNDGSATLQIAHVQDAGKGSHEEMSNLLQLVNSVIESQRPFALQIRQKLAKLEADRLSLVRQLGLEIAANRLKGTCSLVRFF